MTDLQRAYAALNGKVANYTTLFSYADGPMPLIYSSQRLRDAFQNLTAHFEQNWAAVVLDALLDRLTLRGFETKDKAANAMLERLYNQLQIGLDAYDAHNAALITSESFIIAGKDEKGNTEIYYNDPRLCHIFYESENPKKKEFACKWWKEEGKGEGEGYYLTLYYPDRLEYYFAKTQDTPTSAGAFQPMEPPTARNEYGVIPVFHLTTDRRSGLGELNRILTLLDAVNKLLADMMVAAEFGAFKQRWIISQADPGTLKNSPNQNWWIPAGEADGQGSSVGQFDATDLNVYLNAIDKLANSIAIITRTPKHYFFNTGAALSGEALLAMEAPLTKKAKQRQENFGIVWQEIASFLCLLNGQTVAATDIAPVWEPVQSVQPLTEAQIVQADVNAGVPLKTALKWRGRTDAEIKDMEKDQAEEQARTTSMARALLDQARVKQEQANPPGQPVMNNQPPNNQQGGNKQQ